MGPQGARDVAAHVVVGRVDEPSLEDDDRRHLESVLRLRPGEIVGVTDGRGGWRSCRFAGGGVLDPDGPVVVSPRPSPEIAVGLAAVKGERTEWAVQKLSEVGVDRIVVLAADRSVVRWGGSRAENHLARLRRVAREALRQSRGVWLPEVSGVEDVKVAAGVPGAALAEPGGGPLTLDRSFVLVGPEGGWSPDELGLGVPTVGLGPGILRTESAAVAAGVLLAALRSGVVRPAG